MPCVQILPQARTAEQGQSATLHCWHNDYDVSFGLQLKEDEEPSRLPQRCTCGLHMQADRHHVGWLNDESRIR